MRLSKVPTAIMASLLVVLPMLGIQSVKAFSQDYKRTVGDKISVERPLVVAKGDKVSLNVKFVEMLNANNYVWNWNVCGVKSTTVGTTWYTTKTYTMKSIQDCKVSIQAKATYTDPSKKPVNGSVEDTIEVLPSENIDIDFTSPVSAQVGQLFWLESAYNGPQGYNSIRWEWKGSGACKDRCV